MQILISQILCVGKIGSRPAPGAYQHQLITLTTKDTEETVRDPQSCAPSRFENFLRDGGQHRLVYCGKGLDVVATAIFKAKSKNAGIGDRSGYRAFRSRR